MKLSKAQLKVLTDCKAKIDFARNASFEEFINKFACNTRITNDNLEYWEDTYDNYKRGICNTHSNSKTLLKLEEMGLIQIRKLTTGHSYGIDEIQILNY